MSAQVRRQIVDLILSCSHTVKYPKPSPVKGQVVYCRRCDDWFTVDGAPAAYRVRCAGCSFARICGRDLGNARAIASKHAIKRQHKVKVMDGEILHETIAEDPKETLPFESSVKERIEKNKEHQASLRRMGYRQLPIVTESLP